MRRKKKQPEKDFLVGIDIGTSKVVAIVGEVKPDNIIHIVGIGEIKGFSVRQVEQHIACSDTPGIGPVSIVQVDRAALIIDHIDIDHSIFRGIDGKPPGFAKVTGSDGHHIYAAGALKPQGKALFTSHLNSRTRIIPAADHLGGGFEKYRQGQVIHH